MRVVAFAPALSTQDDAGGGIVAQGFPMTAFYVDGFPGQITVPMVMS